MRSRLLCNNFHSSFHFDENSRNYLFFLQYHYCNNAVVTLNVSKGNILSFSLPLDNLEGWLHLSRVQWLLKKFKDVFSMSAALQHLLFSKHLTLLQLLQQKMLFYLSLNSSFFLYGLWFLPTSWANYFGRKGISYLKKQKVRHDLIIILKKIEEKVSTNGKKGFLY